MIEIPSDKFKKHLKIYKKIKMHTRAFLTDKEEKIVNRKVWKYIEKAILLWLNRHKEHREIFDNIDKKVTFQPSRLGCYLRC